ncbi:MAG: hypothetical protein RIQ53_1533 [Pseudomonadota bacterium]|jgi:hypothetical protein
MGTDGPLLPQGRERMAVASSGILRGGPAPGADGASTREGRAAGGALARGQRGSGHGDDGHGHAHPVTHRNGLPLALTGRSPGSARGAGSCWTCADIASAFPGRGPVAAADGAGAVAPMRVVSLAYRCGGSAGFTPASRFTLSGPASLRGPSRAPEAVASVAQGCDGMPQPPRGVAPPMDDADAPACLQCACSGHPQAGRMPRYPT